MKSKILLILQEHSYNCQEGIVINSTDFKTISEVISENYQSKVEKIISLHKEHAYFQGDNWTILKTIFNIEECKTK